LRTGLNSKPPLRGWSDCQLQAHLEIASWHYFACSTLATLRLLRAGDISLAKS